MFRFISEEEVASFVKDGDCIAINSFLVLGNPGNLQEALADSFVKTGHPKHLEILTPASCGCWDENRLIDRCAGLGMIDIVTSSHFGSMPKVAKMVANNEIEGYNVPLGVISHAIRGAAAGLNGVLSKTGIGIFCDPRIKGAALNKKSKRKLSKVVRIDGEEFLYYRTPKIDVALIRGTSVDPKGNIIGEREMVSGDALTIAQATKANGGKVIAQVEQVRHDFDRPRNVVVPGVLVDAVLVAKPDFEGISEEDKRSLTGDFHVPASHMDYWMNRLEVSGGRAKVRNVSHNIIGQRAARELNPGDVVNIGIGIPEMVGKGAAKNGMIRDITLTVESGGIGGLPAPGMAFGAMIGADFICDMAQQFDYYDGGGLDICFMGALEIDAHGNANAHYLPGRCIGIGGFANITLSCRKVVFCVNFTASGLEVALENGRVCIRSEGKVKKFKSELEQISFSAKNALERGQHVLYVTERCVFELTEKGLALIEVYEGVDKQTQVLDLLGFEVEDLTT